VRSIALVAVLLAAGTTIATDGNDVAGKLDLKAMTAARDGTLIRVTVSTWDRWPAKLLAGNGPQQGAKRLTVLYDVTGDGKPDYRGRIVYNGGRLALWISGRGSHFEPVRVTRPTRSSVAFTHPTDVMVKNETKKLFLAFTSKTCARGCADRLPNRGWIPVLFKPPPPPPPH
jgi:hypothetical protein